MKQLIEQAEALLPAFFDNLSKVEKLMLPFPMGVFGTLRLIPEDQGNARLMTRIEPVYHCRAFLPQFIAEGIELRGKEWASAPIELFFYSPDDWRRMIPQVDRLEGIYMDSYSSYNRTLISVKILPDDFDKTVFDRGLTLNKRDLQIPPKQWKEFQSIPAWIYSNDTSNHDVCNFKYNPICR